MPSFFHSWPDTSPGAGCPFLRSSEGRKLRRVALPVWEREKRYRVTGNSERKKKMNAQNQHFTSLVSFFVNPSTCKNKYWHINLQLRHSNPGRSLRARVRLGFMAYDDKWKTQLLPAFSTQGSCLRKTSCLWKSFLSETSYTEIYPVEICLKARQNRRKQ